MNFDNTSIINKYLSEIKNIPKERITGAIYIIITLVLVGFFQFVTADFQKSIFLTATFWLNIATTLIIIFTSYQGGINISWSEQLKNIELVKAMTDYEELNVRDTDFEAFLELFNRNLKKEAYVRKACRLMKLRENILPLLPPRSKDKVCSKIKQMSKEIEQENLDKIIDGKQIRFNRVYISDFFTATAKSSSVKLRARGNAERGKFKASVRGFPFTIAIATVANSMVYHIVDGSLNYSVIVNLVINAVIFAFRLANGILKASKVIYTEIQMPLEFKNHILRRYHEWKGDLKNDCN